MLVLRQTGAKQMNKSEALNNVLTEAGINVRSAKVFGSFAHIDTYTKHRDKVLHMLSNVGFKLINESNGFHLDGTEGFRMSFQMKK